MRNILHVEKLKVEYPIKYNLFGEIVERHKAVNEINFDINSGEIVGIIGESGCGKSSLAKALVGLVEMNAERIVFNWKFNLHEFKTDKDWRKVRKDIQLIFQDPISSLDPNKTIGEIISEPLFYLSQTFSKKEIKTKVLSMMRKVGLHESQYYKYPHEFSGGQCQRVGIARALIVDPKLLICDEPVSALDVSIQAQIINLLKVLQKELNLTIIFISHDLSVVKYICNKIFVLYAGNIVEKATKEDLFKNPQHPYTKLLINSFINTFEKNFFIENFNSDFIEVNDIKKGCPFQNRCNCVQNVCKIENPTLEIKQNTNTEVACWCE